MATCFIAHGNNGIATVAFEPLCFFDSGCGTENLRARGFDPRHQFRGWQRKVEAHHRRPQLLDQRTRGLIKRCTDGDRSGCVKVGTEFGIGLLYDLGFLTYAALPLGLYLLLCPPALWRRHGHQWFLQGLLTVSLFAMLFTAVAEWLFWDEFGVESRV